MSEETRDKLSEILTRLIDRTITTRNEALSENDELRAEIARLQEKLHDEMSQLEIATDLGNKRWLALNDIYENGEKHNANWCKRKAQEGLGIKLSEELYLDEDFRMLAKTYPADVSAIGVTTLIDYVEAVEAELARRDEIIRRLTEDAETLCDIADNFGDDAVAVLKHRALMKELE